MWCDVKIFLYKFKFIKYDVYPVKELPVKITLIKSIIQTLCTIKTDINEPLKIKLFLKRNPIAAINNERWDIHKRLNGIV